MTDSTYSSKQIQINYNMPLTDEQLDATIASLQAILASLQSSRGDAPPAPAKKSRAKKSSPSEEPKPVAPPSEKRIARVTPKLKQALQHALGETFDEKKHPKQYVEFVNQIPEDTYVSNNKAPLDYIPDFLESIGHAPPTSITVDSYTTLSNDVKTVIVEETSPDVFRGSNGITYTVREGLPDEDFEPRVIKGRPYVVGGQSGRVYETRKDEHGFEQDVWVGFLGVGEFA